MAALVKIQVLYARRLGSEFEFPWKKKSLFLLFVLSGLVAPLFYSPINEVQPFSFCKKKNI